MIFLDANSFYDFYGRNSLGMNMASAQNRNVDALTTFLNRRHDKALPESVFIEVLTRFKDDEMKLRNILDFIFNKNLLIFHNIKTWGLHDKVIKILFLHKTLLPLPGELKTFVKLTVVLLKIEIEATIAFCFEQINGMLYVFCSSDNLGLSEAAKASAISIMFENYFFDRKEAMIKEIKNTLCTSYSDHKKSSATMLKTIYMEQLNEFCVVAEEIIAGLNHVEEGSPESLIVTFQNAVVQAHSKGFTGGTDTMHAISNLIKENPKFLQNVYATIDSTFTIRAFSMTQTNYAEHVLFPAWLERGAMLKKNDLFDMLVVGTLDFVEHNKYQRGSPINYASYLITFDATMRNYLASKFPYNENLVNKFS